MSYYHNVGNVTEDLLKRNKYPFHIFAIIFQKSFSVMDRGFVFSLIRTYMKEVATTIMQAGSFGNDSVRLWNLQVKT